MKTCTRCNIQKPFSLFNKCKAARDGYQTWCKECNSSAGAAWYKANKDHVNAKSAAWLEANKDRRKVLNAAWSATNRDRQRATTAAWAKAHPERVIAKSSAWQKAHPEYHRIIEHNRRARKREAGGKLSQGLAAKLFKLQRGKCACGCKQPLGTDYHLDHRMPLALGGSNTDDNIQLLRATCNMQKSAKHPVDFMRQRGFLL